MTIILIALLALIFYFSLKKPSNHKNWQDQFVVLPSVAMSGDKICIKNIRDFRYNNDESVREKRYLDQEYRLSEFKRAWYGISHFGDNNLAHVFISFEFSNQSYLVVSIEARLEKEHTSYNPVKGLFRSFNKTVVLATEQDVIGLRSHIRDERVYLYPLDVPELYTKPLLLNFLREAQVLRDKPQFYNTLIDNCMTGLLAQSEKFKKLSSWLDWRIVLPGGSDEIAYKHKFIDTTKGFAQLQREARINPYGYNVADDDFSQRIREPSN